MFSIILIVLGLCLFETISSIDNAIINAEVLSGMGQKARKWFMTWGLLIAVVAIRGLLPWMIMWIVNPYLGPIGALTASFSNDSTLKAALQFSTPILMMGGGIFLLFLFLHWLFLEEKNFGLPKAEKFFMAKGIWYYAMVSIILCMITWFALRIDSMLAFGAVVGSTAFFITHGFRQNAEKSESLAMSNSSVMSDISKLLFLEIIDAAFSFDGVLGAFAFTFSIPLILIGNGLGAVIVRQLTLGNIDRIKKYLYLKNGAMYSILVLGFVMVLKGFSIEVPEWISPLATFAIVGFFFFRSKDEISNQNSVQPLNSYRNAQ